MAEGGFDEMKEREREQEQEREREREIIEEQEQEQETNFDDVNDNNVLIRPDDTTHTRVDIDDISEKSGVFIEFKGKRIGRVDKNLDPDLFSRKNKRFVDEFRSKLDLARKEYERSPSALVRNLPEDVVDSILDSSIERIDQKIDETTTSRSKT